MIEPSTCRWCDSGVMFGPVFLYPETGMGYGEVAVADAATARLFRKLTTVPLAVWACRKCGHLEQFATEPERLFESWSAGK